MINNHHANLKVSTTRAINTGIPKNPFIKWDEPVLLATAIVLIRSARDNVFYPFRCLLDIASESNYISEEIVQFLGLKKTPIIADMTGLGGVKTGTAREVVDFEVGSKINPSFKLRVQAPVVSKVSNLLPSQHIHRGEWEHVKGLQPADPDFLQQNKVDVLLGSPVYGYLLLPGLIKTTPEEPVAQNTEFGWILSGPTRATIPRREISSFHTRVELDDQLRRFFEQEELPEVRSWTQEEKNCEEFFKKTMRRDSEGRVIVALPFKDDKVLTGTSKGQAISRLMKLESRLQTNQELKTEYAKILDEYEALNHTTLLGNLADLDSDRAQESNFYIPHHAVFKPESTTTKTRIVFDASAKTTSGVSLNETLMVGPTLQDDLTSILLRWRTYKYVFSADIEKMYRQVVICEKDRKFLRFLYRKHPDQPIQVYQHDRLPFGISAATYLAVRALHEVALEGKEEFPRAAEVALRDFYMDDGMSGEDSVDATIALCKDLRELLGRGKLPLRKFISNSTEVLESIPRIDRELELPLEIHTEDMIKTLGIRYHPSTDTFQFKVSLPEVMVWPTKRSLLSEVSKLFDPLGWLAPVIIQAKILFQELWQEGLDWNQKLPENIAQKWISFRNNLHRLETIRINRWSRNEKNIKSHQLHGFSDASEKAFSAVVYSRIIDHEGSIHTTLLTAKTRVAPFKPRTLPRLELCGAVLLANLMENVGKALNIDKSEMYTWSDSTVVIGWIRTHPMKLKTFVANRIVEINNYLNVSQWLHIEGTDNPADCASRGIGPEELERHALWWNGPKCLKENRTTWSQELAIPTATLELKSSVKKSCFVILQEQGLEKYIKEYSSFKKLIRMVALQMRFIHNLRPLNTKIMNKTISTEELQQAQKRLIRLCQEKDFPQEVHHLKEKRPINTKSGILSLNPFLDNEGTLRVGGRLEESDLTYESKHPMILASGPLTDLIISDAHHKSLHGGNRLTMNLVRESFWIVNLRRKVKKHIAKCVMCFRFRATVNEQIMANLPRARITETSPFTHTSVDYAGPFKIKASNVKAPPTRIQPVIVNGEVLRATPKVPILDGYIAVFVCFTTKAIHLEVVSDLTTDTFLAALDRFTSRRGSPEHMYSDNAKTFIGAKNILAQDQELSILDYKEVAVHLANDGTQWHFIPPKAPHFGGLHEAGVKSMKHHLKRVVGDTKLTFEELTTITARIESCLNSRPLCPLTDEPGESAALTPGHFLIGRPLIAPPSGKSERFEGSLQDRWMLVKKLQRDIWKAWSTDYLNTLQQRQKWTQQRRNLVPGNIVLLREDDVPPTKWPLARVVEVYPSQDDNVRSVRIEMVQGQKLKQYDRPICKLCLLPISDNEGEEDARH